jgi:hypothetical protein
LSLATDARRSVLRLLVIYSVVPSSPILVTLMKEALSSSETSVLTRAIRRNIPEDTIPQSYYQFLKEVWSVYALYILLLYSYLEIFSVEGR